MNKPEIGDTLPNRATVIDATERNDEGVVLARIEGPQPWVTWTYRAGHPDSTGSGHYFDGLEEAVRDYKDRGGQA